MRRHGPRALRQDRKAEEAKANLAAAFARETEIRDRLPLLSAARQKLDEKTVLLRDIKVAENA